jgi:hypothetical protein
MDFERAWRVALRVARSDAPMREWRSWAVAFDSTRAAWEAAYTGEGEAPAHRLDVALL